MFTKNKEYLQVILQVILTNLLNFGKLLKKILTKFKQCLQIFKNLCKILSQLSYKLSKWKYFKSFKSLKNKHFHKYVYQIFQIVLEIYKICKNYAANFDKKFGV